VLVERDKVIAAKRYQVKSPTGAVVNADIAATSKIIHQLPQYSIVVVAELTVDDSGDQRARISSPAGWINADDLEPAAPVESLKLDFETFQERHSIIAAGDHYGLEFPFTLDALREFGAEFLTSAFRAAGSMGKDNRVTEIVELKPLAIMGASENAFLTVAYAKQEPGLHTELFVKVPPADMDHKFLQSGSSHSEVQMLRRSRQGAFPVEVARYYFGDYCSHTTNYILITERIKFGVAPIEPAHRKGRDHLIDDVDTHYRVLAKALARLVAAHKTGAMGQDIEQVFPFARSARNFAPIESPEINIDRMIDFIGRIAPHLFAAEATDPAFLQRWREDLLFGLEHKDAVVAYLHQNVDYTGLCHPNLNIDNAWFWRDPAGELQVGLLDWGGVGQMSIAQALSGMLMMPDPDIHLRLVRDVIAAFVSEYADKGGMALDPEELLFQYKASVYSTAICTIVTIVVDFLFRFSDEEYKTIRDRFDSRLQESGVSSGIIWIDNMLREWLEDMTPGDACRRIVAQHDASR